MWKRIWHDLTGHPREDIVWGTFYQGATCRCGTTFYPWDFQA